MPTLEDHYREIRTRHGYNTVGRDLLGVPGLGRRFVAVDGAEAVATSRDRETAVLTGVGMTGPPHAGTVGQILTAVALQEAGLDVQFVLADLEPYHGGADLGTVRALADRYRSFVRALGFDPGQGRLRTQEAARDVMHTACVLAPYYDDPWPETAPTAFDRALETAYETAGEEDGDGDRGTRTTTEVARRLSGLLHLTDFVHPLTGEDGYDQVVLAFGIDEHALGLAGRSFLRETPVEGRLAGLYTRLVPGVGDAPKMSKRLPGSNVHVGMDPATIRERITADDGGRPAESATLGMMRLASRYDARRLDRLEAACSAGGTAWEEARADYAERFLEIAAGW